MTNKNIMLEDVFDWIKDDVFDTMMGLWIKHCQKFNFKTENDSESYGNTFVNTGSYITDESETECREQFKENINFETLMEELKQNNSFKESLTQLIQSWADEKNLEV